MKSKHSPFSTSITILMSIFYLSIASADNIQDCMDNNSTEFNTITWKCQPSNTNKGDRYDYRIIGRL